LALHGRKPVLLDFSADNLDFSRQVFTRLHIAGTFRQADVLGRLPVDDASIDCVWSCGLLEHFDDGQIRHIVSESARVSRRTVVSLVPNASSVAYRLGKWFQEQTGEWKWGFEEPKHSLASFFTQAGLRDIREFSIASAHALTFMTFPGSDALRPLWKNWLSSLSVLEKKGINQGYLLVTVGSKASAAETIVSDVREDSPSGERSASRRRDAAFACSASAWTDRETDEAARAALAWIRAHTVPGKGIAVSNRNPAPYPEVSGYLIPTLLRWNECALAKQYAQWLTSVQNAEGSFAGPNTSHVFVFDTGQAIRGLAAILPHFPQAESALAKACDWIVSTMSREGRMALPPPGAWALGKKRGELLVNEAVHLYVLPGIQAAGLALNTSKYDPVAEKSLRYYIQHCNLTNFAAPNMLLHFYCYIQEALFDLGAEDVCRLGMRELAERQRDDGMVPAYAGENWVCTPGLLQAALVWLKLGERDRALAAMRHARGLLAPSGGFPGSSGEGAEYFPDEEVSWSMKFWLDALAAAGSRTGLRTGKDGPRRAAESIFENISSEDAGELPAPDGNSLPLPRLEREAIDSLSHAVGGLLAGPLSAASPDTLADLAEAAPVLLDWGRRSLAFSAAAALAGLLDAGLEKETPWEQPAGLFLLGGLIRIFRQPEILAGHGAAPLKKFCLQVFRRRREAAKNAPGLFFCFDELREAGMTLREEGWEDCARHWAAGQERPAEQGPGPRWVLEAVAAGNLLAPEKGLSLLRSLAPAGHMPGSAPDSREARAALHCALAWGGWVLGDGNLAADHFCRGSSLFASPPGKGDPLRTLLPPCDPHVSLHFLKALTVMLRCRFVQYFPEFLDDISSDDGRLLFVREHLPRGAAAKVLDLGTAKGRYLRRLFHDGAPRRMAGEDVHPAFIRFMPKGVETKIGTILRSGWDDGSFQAVLLCEVLEHCLDVPAAVTEMRRILADGGTLIIIDKNRDKLSAWSHGIPPWEQWFDSGELAFLLSGNGFAVTGMDPDLAYENRRDGLFFGIAATKKADGSRDAKSADAPFSSPEPAMRQRPYLAFDPRILLGDSPGLVLYTVLAEACLEGEAAFEKALYAKYLSHFPGEKFEHSPEIFQQLVDSIARNGFDPMSPVSALPAAFTFSNGAHRMAASIALGIREIPYLHVPVNNQPPWDMYRKIFSDREYRWLMAHQKRLIGALDREQRLLCRMRLFINSASGSFRDAPFASQPEPKGCILSYQGLRRIGLTGKRETERRFSLYRLGHYLTADMDVLEAGCNCGFLSWLAARRVKHVDAFDAQAGYIQLGSMLKEEYGTDNLSYFVSRFEAFAPTRRYDAIICCALYGWVPLPFAAFIERLDQWLNPGGILLFESHELAVHPEWKEQRALLTARYDLLHADRIDDVDHSFYSSEYREFLIMRKK
jgi:SAM-dependent methyltransferase